MSTTFRLRRLIGDRPSILNDTDIVFRASRPIFGIIPQPDFGLRGFTAIIAPDCYGRAEFIKRNFELDAEVVDWVSEGDAIDEVCAAALADGYTQEDLDTCSGPELLDVWQYRHATGTREVD